MKCAIEIVCIIIEMLCIIFVIIVFEAFLVSFNIISLSRYDQATGPQWGVQNPLGTGLGETSWWAYWFATWVRTETM